MHAFANVCVGVGVGAQAGGQTQVSICLYLGLEIISHWPQTPQFIQAECPKNPEVLCLPSDAIIIICYWFCLFNLNMDYKD